MVDQLYEKCSLAINTLRTSRHNPHLSASLESLLETVSLHKSLLHSHQGRMRRWSVMGRPSKLQGCGRGQEGASGWGSPPTRRRSEPARPCTTSLEVEGMMVMPGPGSLDQVVGHEQAKQVLREAVLMPSLYPQLFTGGARPWSRLLVYGPPGTGKTQLARALAAELGHPFYCLSSATLLSAWVGESEKLIRGVFEHARQQPGNTFIFIDEIDCLCRRRSHSEDEHSRRVKCELLKQLEGVEDGAGVFLMGATNCPWDLDPAFLRRFQQRLYIPLPTREERQAILEHQFPNGSLRLSEGEWNQVLEATQGFSGADLTHLALAAAFQPIRELHASRFWRFTSDNKITPCSSDFLGAMQYPLSKLPADKVVAREVELRDLVAAVKSTTPTVTLQDLQRYQGFLTAPAPAAAATPTHAPHDSPQPLALR